MEENRRLLREGRMPLGHMVMEFGTRGLAKILESAGFDYVVIDMEHTGSDAERIADQIARFKATDLATFVRIPQALYHLVARTLDAGTLGIMAGNMETAEQAKGEFREPRDFSRHSDVELLTHSKHAGRRSFVSHPRRM